MFVEIGALVHKDFGHKVLETLSEKKGVKSISVETGRSGDLFDDKQFGEFGEAAIITVIAESNEKDTVFDSMFSVCELQNEHSGLIYMTPDLIKIVGNN
tara:strand:- start:180 stop:476 length:297 start_codon:yes stop_codon:yes gene_type:complete